MGLVGIGAWALPLGIALAFPPDGDFKPWFEEGDYRVLQVRQEEREPWIRSTETLAAPVAALRDVLLNFPAYPRLFEGDVKSFNILERKSSEVRAHVVWSIPFPYSNRDAVVRYQWRDLPDGGFELNWEDGAREGDPTEGVRIERVRGTTLVTRLSPQSSRVTYTYYGDLGGSFPGWIKDLAWKKEPRVYFEALRRGTAK